MKIAFFEEVLNVRPHNTQEGLFTQCLDKCKDLSDEARTQFSFVVDTLCYGNIDASDSVFSLELPNNYYLTLLIHTLCKKNKTVFGLVNLKSYEFEYYIQDDFTALVANGEVVAILNFNIEDYDASEF